ALRPEDELRGQLAIASPVSRGLGCIERGLLHVPPGRFRLARPHEAGVAAQRLEDGRLTLADGHGEGAARQRAVAKDRRLQGARPRTPGRPASGGGVAAQRAPQTWPPRSSPPGPPQRGQAGSKSESSARAHERAPPARRVAPAARRVRRERGARVEFRRLTWTISPLTWLMRNDLIGGGCSLFVFSARCRAASPSGLMSSCSLHCCKPMRTDARHRDPGLVVRQVWSATARSCSRSPSIAACCLSFSSVPSVHTPAEVLRTTTGAEAPEAG